METIHENYYPSTDSNMTSPYIPRPYWGNFYYKKPDVQNGWVSNVNKKIYEEVSTDFSVKTESPVADESKSQNKEEPIYQNYLYKKNKKHSNKTASEKNKVAKENIYRGLESNRNNNSKSTSKSQPEKKKSKTQHGSDVGDFMITNGDESPLSEDAIALDNVTSWMIKNQEHFAYSGTDPDDESDEQDAGIAASASKSSPGSGLKPCRREIGGDHDGFELQPTNGKGMMPTKTEDTGGGQVPETGHNIAGLDDSDSLIGEAEVNETLTSIRQLLYDIRKSDLMSVKRTGWLLDLDTGEQKWCVVAEMLLCVFDDDDVEIPVETILLSGCEINLRTGIQIENTEDENEGGVVTIPFAFAIECDVLAYDKLFGAESLEDLEEWMSTLRDSAEMSALMNANVAVENLAEIGTGSIGDDNEVCDEGSKSTTDEYVIKADSKYTTNTLGSGLNDPVSSAGTNGMIYNQRTNKTTACTKERQNNKCKKENNMKGSNLVKRSSSFTNISKQDGPIGNSEGTHVSKVSKNISRFRTIGNIKDVDKDEALHGWKMASSTADLRVVMRTENGFLTSPVSWGKGIVRRASDLKDKFFGRKPKVYMPTVRLSSLRNIKMAGCLQNKVILKWQRLWCVVTRGCFYAFRSQDDWEPAEIITVLSGCSVLLVSAEKDGKQKTSKQNVFKISPPDGKSIYLSASGFSDLTKWIQVLQTESIRVHADTWIDADAESCDAAVENSLHFTPRSLDTVVTNLTELKETLPKQTKPQNFIKPREGVFPKKSSDSLSSCSTLCSSNLDSSSLDSGDEFSRHDIVLEEVWKENNRYLRELIRNRIQKKLEKHDHSGVSVTALTRSIYSTGLSGPNNEGLLILAGDNNGKTLLKLSFSASASCPNIQQLTTRSFKRSCIDLTAGLNCSNQRRTKAVCVKQIAPRDLKNPDHYGYMEKRLQNGSWIKYWYVLVDDGLLYCYLTPDDRVTVDLIGLQDYFVTREQIVANGSIDKKFVFQLQHEVFNPVVFATDCMENYVIWFEKIRRYTTKDPPKPLPAMNESVGTPKSPPQPQLDASAGSSPDRVGMETTAMFNLDDTTTRTTTSPSSNTNTKRDSGSHSNHNDINGNKQLNGDVVERRKDRRNSNDKTSGEVTHSSNSANSVCIRNVHGPSGMANGDVVQRDNGKLSDSSALQNGKEALSSSREALLQEVLKLKHNLQMKQRQKRPSLKSRMSNGSDESGEARRQEDNKLVHDITLLRQRRLSTQLKFDKLQQHLMPLNIGPKKKSLFKFGSSKPKLAHSATAPDVRSPHIEEQLKVLTMEMQCIDKDLDIKKHQGRESLIQRIASDDSIPDSRKKMDSGTRPMSPLRSTTPTILLQDRDISLSSINSSFETLSSRGVVISNGQGANDKRENFILTSKSVSRRLDSCSSTSSDSLNSSSDFPQGIGSARRVRGKKREIDPKLMAEIEEFEAMTREALGKAS